MEKTNKTVQTEPSVWGKALLTIRKAKNYELANISKDVLPQSIGKLEKGITQTMSIGNIASVLAGMNVTWREYLRECDIEMVDQVTKATQMYKVARKDNCRFDKAAQYFEDMKTSEDSIYHFIAMKFMRDHHYQKEEEMNEADIRQILEMIQKPDQCMEWEQYLLSNFVREIKNLPNVEVENLYLSRIKGIVSRAKTRREKVYAFAIFCNLGVESLFSQEYQQAIQFFTEGLEILEYKDNPDLLSERLEMRFLRGISKLHVGDNSGLQDCNSVLRVYKLLCNQDDQYNRLVHWFNHLKPENCDVVLCGE